MRKRKQTSITLNNNNIPPKMLKPIKNCAQVKNNNGNATMESSAEHATRLSLTEKIQIFETYASTSNETPKALPKHPERSDSLLNFIVSNRLPEVSTQRNEGSGTHSPEQSEVNPRNIGWIQELYVESKLEGISSSTFVAPIPSAPELDELSDMNNAINPWNEKVYCEPLDDQYLPSYMESVGNLRATREPLPGLSKSGKPSVTSKLFKALKWKASPEPNADTHKVLEKIPKPFLTERFISYQGDVLKLSTKLTPRSVDLQNKLLQMYQDPQKTKLKEILNLKFLLSLQSKLSNPAEVDLHCVEVVLALPKNEASSTGNQQSYTFGVIKESYRNLWMAKILQSVTDVFPDSCLAEFTRAGWCYMKKSVTSNWSGAWLLLAKRELYFYNYQDRQLEQLDLRKARRIAEIESDDTIKNLQTEAGPSLFIDCPQNATLYFIMASPQETQLWKKIIEETAHNNETSLHTQQLTNDEVPVMITKCIDFIYTHGLMSEWIYRKSGSSSKINKLLQLFKEDAFAVQLSREEFSEHDVAAALKSFIRDMSDSLFGSYAISFVSITILKSTEDKIFSYKELLSRLPQIEHQTLKKLIGHLSFIASLEEHNKMSVSNLALIWGSTLLVNSSQSLDAEQEFNFMNVAGVLTDLIKLYGDLFPISPEDVRKEQLMLEVLQKYHSAAEVVSDTVKLSGDLKVWITIECDPENARSAISKETTQVNVTCSPTKTASDICKELASKTPYQWYELSLFEVICDGLLTRLVHYNEKVLVIVLKWSYWDDEADRKNNYLAVRPTTTLNDVFRYIQQAPLLSPITELKFADQQTKTLRSYKLQLIGQEVSVLKQFYSMQYEEVMTIHLGTVHAYLGREAKRDQSSLRWSITLMEKDFKKRTWDSPFIGHILEGTNVTEQILWYSSNLHSLHPNDILPRKDLRSTA